MKKTLFTILAAASIVGCAKEEVVNVNQETIAFNHAFVDNATKAIDPSITTLTLDGFTVYGTTQGNETGAPVVNIYPAVSVTGSVTSVDANGNATAGSWSYDDQYTQYWIAGNTYNFAAVKNSAVTPDTVTPGTVTRDDNGMPKSIAYDAAGQADLLYAEAVNILGKASGNEAVAFTFSHLLSKVYFTVQNTITTNVTGNVYAYRVTDIKITNAYQDGTYYVVADGTNAAGSWAVSTPAAVEFSKMTAGVDEAPIVVGKVSAADEATSYYARLVIPATYTALNVTCKVETLLNGAVVDVQDYDKTVAHTFVKGNSYNFVLSKGLPGDKIKFTVNTVEDWTENTVSSYPSL